MKRILVTGGTGFIGAALVRRLLDAGHRVRVFDDNSRGSPRRLKEVIGDVELIAGDIRDAGAVAGALESIDAVHHLAYINGTEFFYTMPETVLEVAIKGMINVLDGCLRHSVEELYLASSSEVYQTPLRIPTDESAPLIIPDPLNPRFSYGGGKAACELLAINYGRKNFRKVVIYRPHNIYGPDMGWEHVIPQFVLRLHELAGASRTGALRFPIQGSGREMRSFCFIDDFVAGVMLAQDRGEHLNIYHLGTMDEVSVADLAQQVAACVDREIEIVPGTLQPGSTLRRCPDISKARALGYEPRVPLAEGLRRTVPWYWDNMALAERRAAAKGKS